MCFHVNIFQYLFHPDIDECSTEIHNCAARAICTNTNGSYTCTCIEGYEGDGVNCHGKFIFMVFIYIYIYIYNYINCSVSQTYIVSHYSANNNYDKLLMEMP